MLLHLELEWPADACVWQAAAAWQQTAAHLLPPAEQPASHSALSSCRKRSIGCRAKLTVSLRPGTQQFCSASAELYV